ncbi:DUF1345 domain-containing protein [Leucobacter sp. W1153]|uniref:DUF1345 domain-containing protein n=1 Tax=Leucobacter sp. W1153 TaxID=3439064 RepID=UPI003F2EA66E
MSPESPLPRVPGVPPAAPDDGTAPLRPSARPSRISAAWLLGGEITGWIAQIALLWLGARYVLIDDGDEIDEALRLFAWCVIGTGYLLSAALWLHLSVRLTNHDHPLFRRLAGFPLVRWFSLIVTFASSAVGLTAALTLILVRDDPDHLAIYELAAVWTMLVSWALFHWGYSRVYHGKYLRTTGRPPLVFPGTDEPRLADFVYFSFSNGTSFSVSDVVVTTTKMRWTVVWHSVFSFFFNALIIVLSMNTIAGGLQGN